MSRLPFRLRITILAGLSGGLAAALAGGIADSLTAQADRRDLEVWLYQEMITATRRAEEGRTVSALAFSPPVTGKRVGRFDSDGNLVQGTDPPPPAPPADVETGTPFELTDPATGARYVAMVEPVTGGSVLVAAPVTSLNGRNRVIRVWTGGLVVLAVVVSGTGGYLLAGPALRPIGDLARSADELADGPAAGRLPVPTANDEVRRLAETFNKALDLREAMTASQRQMLAELSHEIRTPLARMRADIDLARRPIRSPEEIQEALAEIDGHVGYLTDLANAFLSTVSTSASTAGNGEVTVGELVDELRLRTRHGAVVAVRVAPGLDETSLPGDATMVVSVLCTLIDNALKHGEPPIEVHVARVGDEVEVAVRDHGAGIPDEARDRVFEPYVRGRDAGSGQGLGLSIVQNFAHRAGGTVRIEAADPGCRVVLALPARTGLEGREFPLRSG